MPLTKTKRTLILLGLLLTLLVLQVAAINLRSFWEDESVTGWLVDEDFSTIIEQRGGNNHPPLYWLSASVWSRFFGNSDKAIKAYSVLWLALALGLTYRLGRDLFGERSALLAAALLACSPLVLTYGHNARYYSMAAALTLLAILAVHHFLRLAETRSRLAWLLLAAYAVVAIALLYTVYMAGWVLLALNLWFVGWWLGKARRALPGAFGWLFTWALAQVVVLAAYLPWLNTLLGALDRNFATPTVGNGLLETGLRVGYLGYAFGVGEFYSPLNPLVWLGVALSAGLIVWALIKSRRSLWLPLTVLLVAEAASVLVNLLAEYPQSAWQSLPNRTFFVFPCFVLLLAYGLDQLRPRGRWLALGLLLVVYAVGIFNYFGDRQVIKPLLTVPWRQIMAGIQTEAQPDAVMLCTHDDFACFYYQDRAGFEVASPGNWPRLAAQQPSEVWWVQSNRGEGDTSTEQDAQIQQTLTETYAQVETRSYVPQDPAIADLKARLLGQAPYEYRVVVYHYWQPVSP